MEVAAGLVVAEEVITHTLEGAVVGGVALYKPTLPLKSVLKQFATAPEDSDAASLSRAHHTATVVNGDFYVWGGATAPGQLASNDIHVFKLSEKDDAGTRYKVIPALGREGEKHGVPSPRASHSACSIGERILIFGGTDDISTEQPIEEGSSRVWVFDTKLLSWSALDAETGPPPRSGHQAIAYDNSLMIIHGGVGDEVQQLRDTWAFNVSSGTWQQLPEIPVDTSKASDVPPSLAEANGTLYVITHSDDFTAMIHSLDLKASGTPEWKSLEVPIAFPNPGPRPRKGAGLVPLHTGQGRTYLLYIFGASVNAVETGEGAQKDDLEKMWSGIWALQLPASGAAHAKDVVRESVGLESKETDWAEVDIVPSEQSEAMEGKAHPGPRAYFGCGIVPSTQRILLWGGERPDGTYAGDGWVIDFSSPSIKGMLSKIPGVNKFVKAED